MPSPDAPAAYHLNEFEWQRDELLAAYEGAAAFRPAGDYTAGQFAEQRQRFLPPLIALLDAYATRHPHLRDALGMELSRSRPGTPTAYQFDGLLLAERLARRVGRLKLPDDRNVFPALVAAPNPVTVQQRYHHARALLLACQLAHATTREQLTTPEVTSALQRLRAFGLPDNSMQQAILGRSPAPELVGWWRRCGLEEDRATLRQHTRPAQRAAYDQYRPTVVATLDVEQVNHLVSLARQAVATGSGAGFSARFYARYFAEAALPVAYYQPAARVIAGVTALYGLPPELLTDPEKKAAVGCLHELLSSPAASVVGTFFEALPQQPTAAAERLRRHLQFARFPRPTGPLTSFYEIVGTCLDGEDDSSPADMLSNLAEALANQPALSPANAELAACAATAIQSCYAAYDFSRPADRVSLQQGYELLRPLLPPDEAELLEELLVEQARSTPAEAQFWLGTPGFLAACLRARLRSLLQDLTLEFASPPYQQLRQLLLDYSPAAERPLNDNLFLVRYDAYYFLCRLDTA